MKKYVALLLLSIAPAAMAQAPADAQARAKEEAAARTAWAGKVALFKLCESQNEVAAKYFADAKAAGKSVAEPVPTPECTDPGPFSFLAPDEKPLEVSGAHSPAPTAATPYSTNDPASKEQPPQSSGGTGTSSGQGASAPAAGGESAAAPAQAPAAETTSTQTPAGGASPAQVPAPGGDSTASQPSAAGHTGNTPTSPGTASAPSSQ